MKSETYPRALTWLVTLSLCALTQACTADSATSTTDDALSTDDGADGGTRSGKGKGEGKGGSRGGEDCPEGETTDDADAAVDETDPPAEEVDAGTEATTAEPS